jgi:hypothetical protein
MTLTALIRTRHLAIVLESLGEAPVHEQHVQLANQVHEQADDERSVEAREPSHAEPGGEVARGRVLVLGRRPELPAVVALPLNLVFPVKRVRKLMKTQWRQNSGGEMTLIRAAPFRGNRLTQGTTRDGRRGRKYEKD